MRRTAFSTLLGLALLASAGPAIAADRQARPLGVLLAEGAKIVAASDRLVWLDTKAGVWMCVIEISPRFSSALKYRNVRELYQNWPRALCFNAESFE